MTGSWFWLHEEQCCDREGCSRPVYIDGLCGLCFAGASAPERSAALFFRSLRSVQSPPIEWHGLRTEQPQRPLLVQLLERLR